MEPKLDLSGITIGGEDDHMGGYEFTTSPNDTITLSSLNYGHNYPNTISAGGYTLSPGYGAVPNVSISSTIGSNGTNTTPWFTQNTTSSKINLDGEGADIVVNGSSLVDAINNIRDRLNCLQINPELEKEWEELRALGDQYRKLEKQILEKQATWDRLKAMPPPAID
jgi:hypothetical protein